MNILEMVFDAIAEYQPGKSKINRDLNAIDAELVDYKRLLVDLSDKELGELSDWRQQEKRFKRRSPIKKALITTIFEEPALCYGYKNYKGQRTNGVALAYTRNREFIFRFKERQTSLFVNRQLVGFINSQLQISKGKSKRLLAAMETTGQMRSISVEGREVASFNFEEHDSDKVKKRIVNYIKTINPIERDIVLAYYALHIITKYEL